MHGGSAPIGTSGVPNVNGVSIPRVTIPMPLTVAVSSPATGVSAPPCEHMMVAPFTTTSAMGYPSRAIRRLP